MFLALVASIVALAIGILVGMRVQLAKGRLKELRRGVDQYQAAESHQELFTQTLEQRALFEKAGLTNHVRIINAIQFILLWNWDLRTLLDLLGDTPEAWSIQNAWRQKLLARTLALTAYECLTKLDQLLDPGLNRQHSLRRALRGLKLDDKLSPYVDPIHQDIRATVARHETLLTGIRNSVIGHRDQDAAIQLLWLKQADAKEIEALGFELVKLSTRTLEALQAVIAHVKQSQVKASRTTDT